jgi:hypothetical protein
MLLGIAVSSARAQGLSSSSSPSLSVTAPTEAQYDAGGPSGTTGNFVIATTCTGSGNNGCRLFITYGSNPQGQQVTVQWRLTSATGQCGSPTLNVFQDIAPTTPVISNNKNDNCTATFSFRVNPLSYTTYQAPGPTSGAYVQNVSFTFTRP